jgi:hypothetical protein
VAMWPPVGTSLFQPPLNPAETVSPVTIGLVTGSSTRANGTFGGDARRRDAHRGSDIVNIVDSSNVQYSTYINSLTIHQLR